MSKEFREHEVDSSFILSIIIRYQHVRIFFFEIDDSLNVHIKRIHEI